MQAKKYHLPERRAVDNRLLLLTAGLVSLAVLPHALHIRVEIIGLFGLFIGWRVGALFVRALTVNRWMFCGFSVLGLVTAFQLYGLPVGRDPGVAFLIIMLGLKLLEIKTRRDIRIVLLLGYFIIITHFLYHTTAAIAVPMLVLTFALTWLMLQMGHIRPDDKVVGDARLVGKMLLQALPFMVILFFLFPRLNGALWLLQIGGNQGISGLSDKLSMGTISQLIESREPAFSATFERADLPPKAERYWRGGVLWDTNGRDWVAGPPLSGAGGRIIVQGGRYDYEIELHTDQQNWVFALDLPISTPATTQMRADYTLGFHRGAPERRKYRLTSASRYRTAALSPELRRRGLALAADSITPAMRSLVAVLRRDHRRDAEYAQAVLNYFFTRNFVYTLQPPLLTSAQPVDEFLFTSRRGFCGHYAGSFVTLMRLAGIPARLVIGYLGGEFNPHTEQILVRQSDAHAWAEVWLPARGWTRVDPTAAIAPERIESAIDYSGSGDGIVRFLTDPNHPLARLVRQSRWLLAAAKLQWRNWFVGFDAASQRTLLTQLNLDRFSLPALAGGAFILGLLAVTLVTLLSFRGDRARPDPVQRLYLEFGRKLAGQGLARAPHEGPMDYFKRLKTALPELHAQLAGIEAQYIELRYGRPAHARPETLRQAITQFQAAWRALGGSAHTRGRF